MARKTIWKLKEDVDHAMRIGIEMHTIFQPDSVASKAFDEAYRAWMDARADLGDAFALSLGYGKKENLK